MDFPYLGDIEKRSILALVNTDPAVDFSQPLPPNTIPVAGLQVRDPPSPLPKVSDWIFVKMRVQIKQ